MRVSIVGAGLQARRRGSVVRAHERSQLVVVTASHIDSAKTFAAEHQCETAADWEEIVARDDVDTVIVCTPPDSHAEITIAALREHKHVLCEKPLARTLEECEAMIAASRDSGRILKCGFNHRYHPAIARAKEMIDGGIIGSPIWGRVHYGIGGRPGYESEWRADPAVAAGGHLMEQGIHAFDLFRWFLGDFVSVQGYTQNGFWRTEPLEDGGFGLLRTESGVIAEVFSGLTQWINRFEFEITATDGSVRVDGLGASYGTEMLSIGRRVFAGPFEWERLEFRGGDVSWAREWEDFVGAIEGRPYLGSAEDGLEAMRLVLAVYESSRSGSAIDPRRFGGRG